MEKIYKQFTVTSKAIDLESGIFEAMITTEDVDRQGEIVRATGAQVENYLKNPVVMWAHDYSAPPVARALGIEIQPGRGLRAQFQFPDWGTSEQADTVRRLWAGGFLNATSIGFIPLTWKPVEEDEGESLFAPRDYTSWELLEFSIVAVPANQNALRLAAKAMEESARRSVFGTQKRGRVLNAANEKRIRQAQALLGEVLESLGEEPDEEGDKGKAAVPYADHGTADEGTAWSGPNLGDFTGERWEDLADGEKRRIMAHFAWTANNPPGAYGELKLPHHRAGMSGIGEAVWRGVAAAMSALLGGRGGVDIPDGDKRGVYNHLSRHYAQFDKEPPEMRAYSEEELRLVLDDEETGEEAAEPNMDTQAHADASLQLDVSEVAFQGLSESIRKLAESLQTR